MHHRLRITAVLYFLMQGLRQHLKALHAWNSVFLFIRKPLFLKHFSQMSSVCILWFGINPAELAKLPTLALQNNQCKARTYWTSEPWTRQVSMTNMIRSVHLAKEFGPFVKHMQQSRHKNYSPRKPSMFSIVLSPNLSNPLELPVVIVALRPVLRVSHLTQFVQCIPASLKQCTRLVACW